MILRILCFVTAFISLILFPWPVTTTLTLGLALFEPLAPLALGIAADAIYFAPEVSVIPWFALSGLFATLVAFFLRSRLQASIIGA